MQWLHGNQLTPHPGEPEMQMMNVVKAPEAAGDRLLRLEDVMDLVGLGRSSIYQAMRRNDFPQAVRLSRRCTRWSSTAIQAWVAKQVERAPQEQNE